MMNIGDWLNTHFRNMFNKLKTIIGKSREDKRFAVNHERLWLTRRNIRTFIDIGAYIGEYIDYAKIWFPEASVYAFEPLEDSYKILLEKTKKMNDVKVFNVAIGEKNESSQIYRSSYAPSSSLLPMAVLHKKAFPFSSGSTKQIANVKTLDSIFQDLPLKPNIFIKIDTQGYEDKVIKGGRKVIQKSSIIQLEVSFETLYKSQPLFHDIYIQLYKLGFDFHGMHNQILNPSDGNILQAHVYFINRYL